MSVSNVCLFCGQTAVLNKSLSEKDPVYGNKSKGLATQIVELTKQIEVLKTWNVDTRELGKQQWKKMDQYIAVTKKVGGDCSREELRRGIAELTHWRKAFFNNCGENADWSAPLLLKLCEQFRKIPPPD